MTSHSDRKGGNFEHGVIKWKGAQQLKKMLTVLIIKVV
jgi:hypothetical protein